MAWGNRGILPDKKKPRETLRHLEAPPLAENHLLHIIARAGVRTRANRPGRKRGPQPVPWLMGKPPETTHFSCRRCKPATCGFANRLQAACVDSSAIAAGGLRAKGRLSFKTGVYGAIESPKAACCVIWDKTKTQRPKFETSF